MNIKYIAISGLSLFLASCLGTSSSDDSDVLIISDSEKAVATQAGNDAPFDVDPFDANNDTQKTKYMASFSQSLSSVIDVGFDTSKYTAQSVSSSNKAVAAVVRNYSINRTYYCSNGGSYTAKGSASIDVPATGTGDLSGDISSEVAFDACQEGNYITYGKSSSKTSLVGSSDSSTSAAATYNIIIKGGYAIKEVNDTKGVTVPFVIKVSLQLKVVNNSTTISSTVDINAGGYKCQATLVDGTETSNTCGV